MARELKFAEISNRYIDYLREYAPEVMANKKGSKFGRKYLMLVKHNGWWYFAPESSPKYKDYDEEGNVKDDMTSVIRLGNNEDYLGTIHLGNMIPVPESEIIWYSLKTETDRNYQFLREKREKATANKIAKIMANEQKVYRRKVGRQFTLDFAMLEQKASDFVKKTSL